MLNTNRIVVMNRGDTHELYITNSDVGKCPTEYVLGPDDVLYFGLCDPHQLFENALIKKRYTIDDCAEKGILVIKINPEDTLDLMPGKYYYSIKLRHVVDNDTESIEQIKTIIKRTKFIICE